MKDTLDLNAPQTALVKLLASGKPVRHAAAELGMSTLTAGNHLWQARKANQARTDTELVVRYRLQQAK